VLSTLTKRGSALKAISPLRERRVPLRERRRNSALRPLRRQSKSQVNAEEKLFDEASTDFGEIANVYKVFEPYAALWTNADVC
jgi:hypothetical protein